MSGRLRVMIVDDSKSMRQSAVSLLSATYEVLGCEDGLDAISKIAEFKPDLMLVDIVMPRMDGYETVALVRMNDAFRSIPILMMSQKGGVFDVARGRLVGFDGNVVKPLEPKQLLSAVAEALAKAGHQTAEATP